MRRIAPYILSVFVVLVAAAKDEYTGRYLYAETNSDDTGGITLTLGTDSPTLLLAIAVGHRSQLPYQGAIKHDTVTFNHLPVDKYDLVLVAADRFYEGLRLVTHADTEASKTHAEAVTAEVMKIEGFFDRKQIHRLDVDKTLSGTLVQQWRMGVALKQSGAKVRGSIHSLDLIWFERPLTGWQLVKRRQIYRQELDTPEPLVHHTVPALSSIRVVTSVKHLGKIALPPK